MGHQIWIRTSRSRMVYKSKIIDLLFFYIKLTKILHCFQKSMSMHFIGESRQ